MVTFLNSNILLNRTSQGFREGRSCLSALFDVYDNMLSTLSEGANSLDMIYLDFRFDKIDHGLLCHKLMKLGIAGNLVSGFTVFFIESYLVCRNPWIKFKYRDLNKQNSGKY